MPPRSKGKPQGHEPETPPRPGPRPGVLDIAAYVPGRSKAPDGVRLYKLSSNETPLGPSPAALAAYREAAGKLELYPDGSAEGAACRDRCRLWPQPGSHRLRRRVGRHPLPARPRLHRPPARRASIREHGFAIYPIAIRAAGGTPVVAPETNLTTDVDAILSRVTEKTRVVFIANPNNPTGTYIPF